MSDEVGASYDAMVELYAQVNLDALDHDANARDWLEAFARCASDRSGPVVDLGCGPGHIVDYLCGLGLIAGGYDISAGQIAKARATFPSREFHVGDFASLELADDSVGGIVSRYSVIHMPPSSLVGAFREWARVLEPEAPVLVSFFGSLSPKDHGTPFDHKVTTAYELDLATIGRQLTGAGLTIVDNGSLPAPPGSQRPYDQATILAMKPPTRTPVGHQ